jgi:cyclopropane fatty-acyl-phospholipid synthase-like methyltransferase
MSEKPDAVVKAEEYYDSSPAVAFYKNVWGGEDIHIGLYHSEDEDIGAASRRTVVNMAQRLSPLGPDSKVIDLGAGFGGTARYLASNFACHVTCLNVSETQNALNREMNDELGLSDKIDVIHGSFEEVPQPDAFYDVAWSQDAILHSANRETVLDEVQRLLKPEGEFIFTDPMQSEDCPPDVLQPILDRIHLEDLGSVQFYKTNLEKRGFAELETLERPDDMRTHYARVKEELSENYGEICALSGADYVDNMLRGLGHWVEGVDNGHLAWGILHFQKTADEPALAGS